MSGQPVVALPGGEKVPALGQGTWKMAEERGRRGEEIAALRAGIELGMTLIDTAEMYGEGRTEELVGEAVSGLRDSLFLVSKAYPHNAGAKSLPLACERSLRRLGTDRIDLYLLHWRGGVPLAESVEAFETLKRDGKIRHWGVSNFDVGDLRELAAAGGQGCATNQILYNFARRGPEFELLPVMESGGMPVMAYSPVEQGRVPAAGALATIAKAHAASVHQIALAWLLRRKHMIVIPKASRIEHVRQNHAALGIALSAAELAAIDKAFPPPRGRAPLEML
ncbi:Aldo/keto reductase [Rhizobiales bacterium GAS188]|nr:Aldo/keto reductase [Rhizobiales bacterium GAS188]